MTGVFLTPEGYVSLPALKMNRSFLKHNVLLILYVPITVLLNAESVLAEHYLYYHQGKITSSDLKVALVTFFFFWPLGVRFPSLTCKMWSMLIWLKNYLVTHPADTEQNLYLFEVVFPATCAVVILPMLIS